MALRAAVLTAIVLLGVPSRAAAPRVPVLVELFTSEGCSSCPPADALLSELLHDQPVAGAEIVPIGLHVDYWDQLGWKDVASSHDATARQQAYARTFGDDNIYTPQAIVDGRDAMVGSDSSALRGAITRAAARPHASLQVTASMNGQEAAVSVSAADLPADAREPLDVVVALVEDGVSSSVTRGENTGRTLHHDAVVRSLRTIPFVPSGARAPIPVDAGWRRDHLRIVAFLQGRRTRRVWGAAAAPL